MRLRGRVGNTTYYTEGGRQIARVSQNSSNYGETASRTESQQAQRAKWANLVNFYKLSKAWMRKAFESKKTTQSDYNRFMQLNLSSARVYLTRTMYAAGGMVVDAFRVSEGSLRTINVGLVGEEWQTDLKLGALTIGAATSVAEFSEALVKLNTHIQYGMQISFISYQQEINDYGVPTCVMTPYEVTLSATNEAPVLNYLPEFCCNNVDEYLGTNNDISVGAFVYILSNSTLGKTQVSSQNLIVTDTDFVASYCTPEAMAASIESYGVDQDVFLMSGSEPTIAASQPVSIAGINTADGVARPGDKNVKGKSLTDYTGEKNIIVFGTWQNCNSIKMTLYGSSQIIEPTSITRVGNDIKATFNASSWIGWDVESITVQLDGKNHTINFLSDSFVD